jgi:L-fucose mutarotase
LNLAPDVLKVTEVRAVLLDAVPLEAAAVMVPDAGEEPTIFGEFRALLPGFELAKLGRTAFYAAASGPDLALLIATGERRLYANLLLTIGAIPK